MVGGDIALILFWNLNQLVESIFLSVRKWNFYLLDRLISKDFDQSSIDEELLYQLVSM